MKKSMFVSYPKSKIHVTLFEHIEQTAVRLFEKEGYSVDYIEKPLSDSKFFEKVQHSTIIGIRSRTQINQKLLTYANHTIAIGAYCIGTNQIDLLGTMQKGIAVFNAPYSNTRSVVELVIGLIIMLIRNIPVKNKNMHEGIWDKSAKYAHEIRGKTLGIIGYGNIGAQLSVLAEVLGMKVLFYDIVDKLSLGNAVRSQSMQELLRKSDIITVHVDGNSKNKLLIDTDQFALMKTGVLFLNLSRGFVVNIKALIHAVKIGKIRGAAIDVFPQEPKNNTELFVSQLQHLDNVILTPHIGGSTEEAQAAIARFVSEKIIEYINTGNSYLSVNIPQIRLTKQKYAHRLLHLHKNVPGILAQINSILSKHNTNILGQYLKTNEHIGYAITDVNKTYDASVIKELKQIPDTIRFRVLY